MRLIRVMIIKLQIFKKIRQKQYSTHPVLAQVQNKFLMSEVIARQASTRCVDLCQWENLMQYIFNDSNI